MRMLKPAQRLLLILVFVFLTAAAAQAKSPRRHNAPGPVDSAYIYNSGTASVLGYRIYVSSNGRIASATLYRSGRTTGGRHATLTPAVTRRFFADLAASGPVDALPMGPNGFTDTAPGVRVTIRYHGRQSSNLRESSNTLGATLYQDAKQIAQVLRLPVPDNP